MGFSEIFKKGFLSAYSGEITFRHVLISMCICVVLSLLVCIVYYFKSKKYFFSKEFAVSIVALALITTAIILTIQSSIVVSLGMVGALSIVRFRTAIKNPLDLVFLFWSISIGIICGAGLYYIAVLLTLIAGIVILISDEIPGVSRNKILVLDGKYPYDDKKLKGVLDANVGRWNIKTQCVHNDSVNLIIETRKIKDEAELIKSIRTNDLFSDVSILTQEGTVD